MKIFKKLTILILVFCLSFVNPLIQVSYAQTATSSAEIVENTADTENSIVSVAESGDNVINVIEVETEPSEDIEEISEIVTEDSTSAVEVENVVNSSLENSEVVNQTINIYVDETVGDIDLSALTNQIVEKITNVDKVTGDEVNVSVSNEGSFTYLVNNISSEAVSGENSIEGSEDASISTGDTYSVVSVQNIVNSNIIDSKIYNITINIFGVVEGNIILPENEDSCLDCGKDISVSENTAEVVNDVTSTAVSGQNTATSSGDVQISSGDAKSSVNISNIVNSNISNATFNNVYINVYGDWTGNFLGWDTNKEYLSEDESCQQDIENTNNTAYVENNIFSVANTGGNNISSEEGGSITTGNAYSSVSISNIINSQIINSRGLFAYINIFGLLIGDIGGESFFPEEKEEPESVSQSSEESQQSNEKEPGGELLLEASHNVGTHVLPGDTITFTVKVKNPGHGKLYETKVLIELFKDGESYGGSYYDLGDIYSTKSKTLSTGLVLSKDAKPGKYQAVVTATGVAGPDIKLSESKTLPFVISGFSQSLGPKTVPVLGTKDEGQNLPPIILGTSNSGLNSVESRMISIFALLLLLYLMGRGYQKREKIVGYAMRIGSLL